MNLITRFRIWRLRRKARRLFHTVPPASFARSPQTGKAADFHTICAEIRRLRKEDE